MKLENFNVKTFLAIFIVFFGVAAMVFKQIDQMVLGALIGYIGSILQFYFGSSKGSEAKDKVISDLKNNAVADDIGGGGIKNDPPPKKQD